MKKLPFPLLFFILVFSILLSACTGSISSSSWPGVSVDQNNAYLAYGPYVYAVNISNGTMVWRAPEKAGKGFYAQPVLTNEGHVVVGGYDNLLYDLNIKDGTTSWTFNGGDKWVASPLISGKDIYAPNAGSGLYKLDLQKNLQWEYKTGNANWSAPASDNNNLYLPSMDHSLYAISQSTGKDIWKIDLGGAVVGTPALSSDGILYAGTLGNEIVAVNAADGKILWRFSTSGGVWSGPTLQGNTLYFGDLKGTFYGLDVKTQQTTLKITPDGLVVSQPLVSTDKIVFTTETSTQSGAGSVIAIDPTGKVLWNKTISGKLYTSPVQAGDKILVAVTQGDSLLVALDQNGNQVWTFQPPK